MYSDRPLQLSQSLLTAMGTRMFVYHENRIPSDCAVVVVSNHRGFMDAPVTDGSIKASHPHCLPPLHGASAHDAVNCHATGLLSSQRTRTPRQGFFQQASQLLEQRQWVGVFPEGAQPMIQVTKPDVVGKFHRGFAHLALRVPVRDLAVLPVAIASLEETVNSAVPLRLLRLFDPSEPLFEQPGWHPMVIHRHVAVLVGRPYWITPKQREDYQGKQARTVVSDITTICRDEISKLLYQSFQ